MGIGDFALWVAGIAAPLGFGAYHVSPPRITLARVSYGIAAAMVASWEVTWSIETAQPLATRILRDGTVGAITGLMLTLVVADTFGVFRKDQLSSPDVKDTDS